MAYQGNQDSQSPSQNRPNPLNWLGLGVQPDTEAENNALMDDVLGPTQPVYQQQGIPQFQFQPGQGSHFHQGQSSQGPQYFQNPYNPPLNTEGQIQNPGTFTGGYGPYAPNVPFVPNVEIPQMIHTQGSGGSRHASRGSNVREPSASRALFQDSQPEEDDEDETQVPTEQEIPQPRRGRGNQGANPPKRARSAVWDHFDLIQNPRSGKCKSCGKIVSADNDRHGTTLLRQHINRCSGSSGSSSSTVSLPSSQAHREMLVRLIVSTDLPISFIETDGFIEYVNSTLPGTRLVSRYTLRRDILKYFQTKKLELQAELQNGSFSVALTSDIWSGKCKEDFLSVVVHNIDENWVMNKRIIGFARIEGNHTGLNIFEIVLDILLEWKLESRVYTITLDNAASNSTMMDHLKNILKPQVEGMDDSFLHQRCATHIINLIVKSGMKRFKDVLDKVRYVVSWLNASNVRLDRLKRIQKHNGLAERDYHSDMPVRWNSTYLMLSHILAPEYKEIFINFVRQNLSPNTLHLTDTDILQMEIMVIFLKIFFDHTCQLSAVYTPTTHIAMHSIVQLAMHFKKYLGTPVLTECVQQMSDKFLKYWGPKKIPHLYAFGTILDPRSKFETLSDMFEALTEIYDDPAKIDYNPLFGQIEEKFVSVYRLYEAKYGQPAEVNPPIQRQRPSPQPKLAFGFLRNRSRARGSGRGQQEAPASTGPSTAGFPAEIERYRGTRWVDQDDSTLDVLMWWKDHQPTFPILSIMARDILSVPVSTVSSESAFSSAGLILDDRRRSLSADMVEALTLCKDWFQAEKRHQEYTGNNPELDDLFSTLNVASPED